VIAPAETVARAGPLLPVFGITRVADVTGLDRIGIPVVMVCRPNARSLSVTQAKGLDLDAARASGIMEAIEAYHAEHIALPLRLASYDELRFADRVVDVTALPRLSVSAFDEDFRTLWVAARELAGGAPVWVPYEMVHLDYRLPLPSGSGSFFMSSSGLASGNHPLEAVSHAICELVEHDATTLFDASAPAERARRRIDLATIDDADARSILDRFAAADVDAIVWETTTDVGIPSFLCRIADAAPDPDDPTPPSRGMGCHPSRAIALVRALTEAAQSRVTLITGSRDDAGAATYDAARARAAQRDFDVVRAEPAGARSFLDAPTRDAASIADDVAWEAERLAAAGLGAPLVVDLTRAGIGVPVVRVIVPGLEAVHDAPGYVPGARARRVRGGAPETSA